MLDLRRREADKIHTKLKLNDTIAAVVALCLGFLAVLDNEFYRLEKS